MAAPRAAHTYLSLEPEDLLEGVDTAAQLEAARRHERGLGRVGAALLGSAGLSAGLIVAGVAGWRGRGGAALGRVSGEAQKFELPNQFLIMPGQRSGGLVEFDCDAEFNNWQQAWSPERITWCCEHVAKGCEPVPMAEGAAPDASVVWATGVQAAPSATLPTADVPPELLPVAVATSAPSEVPLPATATASAPLPAAGAPSEPSPAAAAPSEPVPALEPDGTSTAAAPLPSTTAERVAAGAAECAWPGDDCSSSRCCRVAGAQCFTKDEFYSGCREDCAAGEPDESGDGDWSCEVLGGPREARELAPAGPGEAVAGSSLFCFVGALMDAEEGQLVGLARERGAHIFSCDAHAVYETERTDVGEWMSFSNTDVFIKIWKQVFSDAAYKDHDWSVKVDPDAIFLPDRLKQHLEGLRAPAGASLYLKNCHFKFGFMGSLEVLSTQAVKDYAQEVESCSEHLGHDGGEDFYLMSCLDAIGVRYMVDDTVLNDKYTYTDDYDLGDISFCGSGSAAAYHPLKRPDQWQQCHDAALR